MFGTLTQCVLALISNPKKEIQRYLDIPREALVQPSKNQARKFPEKVWALPDGKVVVIAQTIPEFTLQSLPKTGVPILRSLNRGQPPKLRLIFLPGLGADISHMGTLISQMRAFDQIVASAPTAHPVVDFLKAHGGTLDVPTEIVAFDMPGGGWAAPVTGLGGVGMARYLRDVITEIDAESPAINIAVTRSGSGAPALVAVDLGAPLAGVVMTAPTFPDRIVLEQNFADIKKHAEAGEYVPNWPVLDAYRDGVLEKEFLRRLHRVAGKASKVRILSLVGENDGQTSPRAQDLWNQSLRTNRWPSIRRAQFVIPGTGHFVFQRQSEGPLQVGDSDIQAYLGTVGFIRNTFNRVEPEIPDVPIQYYPL